MINIAIEKLLIVSPPKIRSAIKTNKVVKEVIKVLPIIWLRDLLIAISELDLLFFLKFSLTLSETTMVSLREYPITAKIAAKTDKSKSREKKEKNPSTITTSCINAKSAPRANLY